MGSGVSSKPHIAGNTKIFEVNKKSRRYLRMSSGGFLSNRMVEEATSIL
jgi:hypothetical protein